MTKLTADETYTMMVDAARGLAPERSRLAPLGPEHLAVYRRLQAQIAEIRANGRMEYLPFDC